MNVGITAPVDPVQDPRRERRAKIPMQSRHSSFFDAAAEPATHHKFSALPESFNEGDKLSEIVGQVGITHNNPLPPDVADRVYVGAAQAALGSAQDFPAMGENDLGGLINGAIHDQNLPAHSRSFQALLTPVHKFAHGDLFVQRRNDNAYLDRARLCV